MSVLCPLVPLYLRAEQEVPARRMIEAGLAPALATDFNPGSCPAEAMSAALWFACLTAQMTVDEAICAATLNAAHSLSRAERVGSLEPGKRADVVIHDVPNRYHLVYRFGEPRVSKVIAGGELVYEKKAASSASRALASA